jgi:hypothetical protein
LYTLKKTHTKHDAKCVSHAVPTLCLDVLAGTAIYRRKKVFL